MGKPVTSNVNRNAVQALNMNINKEVFEKFKDYCAKRGYPMNVLIETFMQQYANERFELTYDEIIRWKKAGPEDDVLNTTFDKEIYFRFKAKCKGNGYFVKHVIMAFMHKLVTKTYRLEYVEETDNV